MPDGDAQAEAAKLVRELFEQEYKSAQTPAGQTALANKLLEEAAQSKDDAMAYFVILCVARDMAVQAGDAKTALEAVDRLSPDGKMLAPRKTRDQDANDGRAQ